MIFGNIQERRGSARGSTAINVGGGDQTVSPASRGIYISGNGNLTVRLVGDSSDQTFTGLLAGTWYPFAVAIVRSSGATATGVLLF